LIVSKKWFKWAVLTLIDRKTRMPQIFKLKDKSSKNVMKLIVSVKEKLWIKTVTFDNWLEFAFHQMLNKIWIDTYFCEPYHSREKWSIENLNKIIRIFFPKGAIFDNISHQKIRSVSKIIANTPREILDFLSPNQAHFQ
jgi:IS30 family transposase